jgi:hypothetical protein
MKDNGLKILLFSIGITLLSVMLLYAPWKHPQRFPMKYDVAGYYLYLPAFLIHHDVYMKFLETSAKPKDIGAYGYSYKPVKNGYTSKYHIGLSLMYLPFFLIGILLAWIGGFSIDGYSEPFQLMMSLHPVLYLCLSYYFLYKTFVNFFSYKVVVYSLLLLLFATHLFFYSTIAGNMPHVYLFFLISIMMYYTEQWIKDKLLYNGFIIVLVIYLILIIRPTSVVVALYVLARWWIYSGQSIHEFVIKNGKYWIIALGTFILLLLPVLIYWKVISGDWILYTYRDEKFDFLHPRMIEVLIGFRKGWLVYSPFLLISILGSIVMYRNREWRVLVTCIVLITILHIYIISSWWCWWYGGSLGMRTMIDVYPLLLFPIIYFTEMVLNSTRKVMLVGFVIFSTATMVLNGLQSFQYLKGILVFDGMSASTYFKIFGRTTMSEVEMEAIQNQLMLDRGENK